MLSRKKIRVDLKCSRNMNHSLHFGPCSLWTTIIPEASLRLATGFLNVMATQMPGVGRSSQTRWQDPTGSRGSRGTLQVTQPAPALPTALWLSLQRWSKSYFPAWKIWKMLIDFVRHLYKSTQNPHKSNSTTFFSLQVEIVRFGYITVKFV